MVWLKENFEKPFSIKLIAEQTNMSPSGLHHHFKTLTNMTPFNIKSTFACKRLDGSCWPTRWMLLLPRITLDMRAGHSSAANTAVSLEPRHVGMWSRSGSRLGKQNCEGGYAACSNHEFGDDSMTLDERQLAATIETWPPIIAAV